MIIFLSVSLFFPKNYSVPSFCSSEHSSLVARSRQCPTSYIHTPKRREEEKKIHVWVSSQRGRKKRKAQKRKENRKSSPTCPAATTTTTTNITTITKSNQTPLRSLTSLPTSSSSTTPPPPTPSRSKSLPQPPVIPLTAPTASELLPPALPVRALASSTLNSIFLSIPPAIPSPSPISFPSGTSSELSLPVLMLSPLRRWWWWRPWIWTWEETLPPSQVLWLWLESGVGDFWLLLLLLLLLLFLPSECRA